MNAKTRARMIQSGLFFVNSETRVLRKHFSLFSLSLHPCSRTSKDSKDSNRKEKGQKVRNSSQRRTVRSFPARPFPPLPPSFPGLRSSPISLLLRKKGKGPRFARPKAVGGLKAVTLAAARPFSRGREGEKRAKAAAKPGKDTRAELGSRLGRGENWSRMTGKSLLAKAALLHTWASQGEASFFLSPYASSRPLS